MHSSSFKGWEIISNSIIIAARNTGTHALERVLVIHRHASQLLKFHCVIPLKVLSNSEKENKHPCFNKVPNSFPDPHPFMPLHSSLTSLGSKCLNFSSAPITGKC